MKRLLLTSLLYCLYALSWAQLPTVAAGSIKRLDNFSSQYVSSRHVDVWLPDGYTPNRKYAVLYMQDGQMLFDSSSNWNKQEWAVDETLTALMRQGTIRNCIVVAPWNTGGGRHADYMPQKPVEQLSAAAQDSLYHSTRTNGAAIFNGQQVHSDLYLKFLVEELKPFIDSSFSTLSDQGNTFIAGSSMGGLISLYAICEYPAVFGGAACLSTHWPGIFTRVQNPFPAAMISYVQAHLPSPSNHRIYFDHGTATLDSMYADYQQQVDAIMRAKGYGPKQWITKVFPGADHSERAWRSRLQLPMLFLLGIRKH